jgi:uncharacterized protein (DUF2141 family)
MTSRHPWGRCLRWVGAAGVAAGALAVIAGKPQPAVDAAEYQAIMADEAGDATVLQDRFEEQRWLSLPLLPPGPEVSVALPLGGRVVPFDWKRFPKEFVAGLEGRWENSVPVYDLSLAEDPLTHETLFFNAAGEPILRLPAPSWSDPADLRLTLASLYGVVLGSADAALFDARLWDPSRLQARLTLIRPEDVEYYLYAEAKVRDYATSLEATLPPPVMMLMGGESEFCIAAVQRATNGIRLEIELPAGFTNRVDVFGSTNLVAFEWAVLADALSTTGGSPLVWTDTPLPATLRFYAAGDADTDSDLDGLTDAREVFLHRTCPTNLDTDADGLVDGNSGVVGTNLYAGGVQSNGYVQGEMTLGTSQLLADTDDDGVSDGAEVAGGSDPLDPNLPPNVNGTVVYSGLQTGTVRVIAVAVSGSWSTARQAAIPAPGAYRIANLPPSNYWIRAFVDSNGDGTNDAPEARGEWAEGAVLVTNRVTDIDFSLADPDDDADGLPDWWEILHWSDTETEDGDGDPDLDGYANWEEYLARTDPEDDASHPFNVEGKVTYSGPLEGSIVVLASTSSASWAGAGSVTVNATGTFAILHLPVGASYWVKAFRDSDEDGVLDFGEAWGEDGTEYVLDEPVTNAAVALVDHDADGDDLADWFEVAYGLDPQTGSNSFVCGWWKMNGSGAETNVVDVSGNTNDGWLVSAAATSWGEGVLHGALALSGSNYVQLADNETLAPSGLTLALWLDPAADLTNGAAVLFSKKDPAAATGYSLAVTNGKLEWLICQAGVHVLTAPVVLTNGAWRHVAATYGAGRQRIYVDGVQAAETNWSMGTSMGYLDQGTTAPRIGASTDTTPARLFPGLVDDVRLYDGEFTSNQVWSIYEAGADLDGDTLRPAAEMAAGSSPSSADTDGDGVPDAVEVAEGTLANNPDTDGDGADDGLERSLGSGAKTPNVVYDLGPDQVTIEARQSMSQKSKTIAIPGFVTNGLPDFYLHQVKGMVNFGEDVGYAGTWLSTAYREVTIELGCGVRQRVNGNRHDDSSSSSYYGYSYFEGDVTGTNYGVGSIAYWGNGSSGWTNFNSSNNEIEGSDATNYVWEGVALPVSDWSEDGDTNKPGYSRQATPSTLAVSWVIDEEDPQYYNEYAFQATNSDPFSTEEMMEWATNDLWAASPFTTTNLPWGWSWSNNYCGVCSTNESADAKAWRSLASNDVDYGVCAAQYRFRVTSPQTGVIYRAMASRWFTPAGSTNNELIAVTNLAGYCTNAAADFHLPVNGALLAPPVENGTASVSITRVDITFADPDGSNWPDLEENKVILCDKNTRIKLKVSSQMPDLQAIFDALGTVLKIKTSGTSPNGQDYTLTTENTTLVQHSGYSEMRVTLTRDELKTMGVLPGQEADSVTEKAWLDHGSSSSSEPSNLTDGIAYDSGLGDAARGKSTNYGDLNSTPPNSPVDKTFFVAAGREIITAKYGTFVSHKRQVMNQADHFYFSGHGSHSEATLQGGFGPGDVTGYWDKDLDYTIIAGCAVLDIKNYRAQSFGPGTWLEWWWAGGDCSPGAQWEPKGPRYLIGYNWTAPLDNQGSAGIISNCLSALSGGASVVNAWKQANDLGIGRNACVIDCSANPHVYWYWDETSGTAVWTNVMKSGGSW